jgi:hypothetical protein
MYENFGFPPEQAKKQAKIVFEKANSQSAEKILQIEKIKTEKPYSDMILKNPSLKTKAEIEVAFGTKTEKIDVSEREKAINEITEKFGVDEEIAKVLLIKTAEELARNGETELAEKLISDEKKSENTETNLQTNSETADTEKVKNTQENNLANGHEKTPSEEVTLGSKTAEKSPVQAKKSDIIPKIDVAETDISTPKRGRR